MKNQPNHILLVEDNSEDYDVFMYALQQVRISVDVTRLSCGRQAQEFLVSTDITNDKVPGTRLIDLIVLDINLPRVSGLQLLKDIREIPKWFATPTVMLTTSPEPKDIKEAYRNGANSFLVKPVALDSYMDLLNTMCRYWLLFSQSISGKVNIANCKHSLGYTETD